MANANPFSSIHRSVEKVYRRLAYQSVTKGVCAAITAVALCSLVTLLGFGIWEPSEDQFYGAIGIIATLTAGSFFSVLGLSLKQHPSIAKAAEYWESSQPELKDGLIACVHFEKAWERNFRGSQEQAQQLADWVENQIKNRSVSEIVPWRRLTPYFGLLSLSGVAWLLALLAASDQLADGIDSLNWDIEVENSFVSSPLVGDIHITVDPPKYTRKSRRFIPNSSGDVQVMQGSTLTVRAVSVEPISEAFAVIGSEKITAVLEGERNLSLAFTVDGPTDWRFGVMKIDGENQVESDSRRIKIIPDQAPIVEMTEPKEDLELENVRAVPVVFDARDDIGLSRVAIHIALAGDEENSEEINQGGFSGVRALGSDEIDLTSVEAQAGDRIAIWVRADDNREPGGVQTGQSSVRYITIRSPEFNHYEITESLHALVGILLDTLASRLESEFVQETNSLVGKARELNTQTTNVIAEAQSLVSRMIEDPLTADEITKGFETKLRELEKKVQQETISLSRYATAKTPENEHEITNMSLGNENVISELENIIIYVEAMVSRLALEDIAAMTDEIRAAKARLTDLINAYKNNRTDALKARIMRNVKRLKSRIQELRKRMAKLRQKLPDEFLNMEGLKSGEVEQGLSDTQDQLDDIEKMLEEDRLDEAMKALDEMSETLDSLSDALNEDMQNLHDQTNPQLQKALSELMDEARDLYKRQEKVSQDTRMRSEVEKQKQKALMEEEKMRAQMDKIRQLANQFRGTVDDLAGSEFPPFAEESLAELQEHSNAVLQALDVERLRDALKSAKEAEGRLYSLRSYARMNRGKTSTEDTIRLALAQDLALINAINELLREMQNRLSEETDNNSMEQLRQSQQALSESARRLRQMMNEKSEMIPGLQGKPLKSLDQAQSSMGRAQKSLGENQPSHAQSEQSDALSQLKGLMKGLKQASKPQSQRQQAGERGQGGRRRTSSEKVKIPTADDHSAPAEFRKELMDAMKEKPPEAYRESVRRYYESLVE